MRADPQGGLGRCASLADLAREIVLQSQKSSVRKMQAE